MPRTPPKRSRAQSKRSQPTRRRSIVWRWRRPFFALFLLGLLSAAAFLFALARAPLPAAAIDEQTTFFYDSKGRRLASIDAGENRVSVPLEEVPPVVRQAVLATEDRKFYEHSGLDPVGIVRALWNDIRGNGPLQGGSTITQQYVKNSYLTSERTITRKVKEAIISLKVERKLDKDEILERYLNTIYFGRGAYGLQAASRAYFGKDLAQVTLPEAAYLAGLIRAPELADAEHDPETAEQRRNRTLRQMERAGFITGAEREAAERVRITDYVIQRALQEPVVVGAGEIGTEHFVEHVRRQLVNEFGEAMVAGGGLRVTTTLDLDMQRKAYEAVYGLLDRPTDPGAALVAVDEGGHVRAMVGGRGYGLGDPRFDRVNFATGRSGGGSGRQAGSTFKAPSKVSFPHIRDPETNRPYTVHNYEGAAYDGVMNMIEATEDSVNTVYAQAADALGPEHIVASAKEMGIQSPLDPVLSIVLGTHEVSPLEMAGAYSTFARRGERIYPFTIIEVKTADGRVLKRADGDRARVLGEGQADQINFALRRVVEAGTGTAARLKGQAVAGKTGTTQEYGDAWFVGYTPKLTTAVWMGHPEGNSVKMRNVRGRRVSGGSFPAAIFKRFMDAALDDPAYAGGEFPKPRDFGGKVLKGGARVGFAEETTTTTAPDATTTTTVAERPAETTTTTQAPPSTTTTSEPKKPTTTTTANPSPTTTTTAPRGRDVPGDGPGDPPGG